LEVIGSASRADNRYSRAPGVEGNGRGETLRELAQDARATAAALRREARLACDSARAIVADSLVITHVSRGFRTGAYTQRCAWCGRYRIDERWMLVGRPRHIHESRTRHGICDDCLVALREVGQSV
jgi:hypothetical protein